MYLNWAGGHFMTGTTMVHIRMDDKLKAKAAKVLESMGLTISDAVRIFLKRVAAEKQLPFAIRVPNAQTREAMEEARTMTRARFGTAQELFDDLEKNRKP
jgi:DNA-damage-inducible protein J